MWNEFKFHKITCVDVELLIVQYSLEECPLLSQALARLLHCPVPSPEVASRYCQYLQSKSPPQMRFQKACGSGDLCIVQWLTHEFKLTGVDARAGNNYAFQWAAYNGHLKFLQWLTQEFKLTREDARANHNWAFRSAATYGHLHVLQWLTQEFKLQRRHNNGPAYRQPLDRYKFNCMWKKNALLHFRNFIGLYIAGAFLVFPPFPRGHPLTGHSQCEV